jgi:hypothetical protein
MDGWMASGVTGASAGWTLELELGINAPYLPMYHLFAMRISRPLQGSGSSSSSQ